jgi:hypothetical protein
MYKEKKTQKHKYIFSPIRSVGGGRVVIVTSHQPGEAPAHPHRRGIAKGALSQCHRHAQETYFFHAFKTMAFRLALDVASNALYRHIPCYSGR